MTPNNPNIIRMNAITDITQGAASKRVFTAEEKKKMVEAPGNVDRKSVV